MSRALGLRPNKERPFESFALFAPFSPLRLCAFAAHPFPSRLCPSSLPPLRHPPAGALYGLLDSALATAQEPCMRLSLTVVLLVVVRSMELIQREIVK